MQAIEETPPPASVSKMTPPTEATTAEATNLESTLSNIDKVLLEMAAEEAFADVEETLATVPEKGKEIAEDISVEKASIFKI
jgi:hypothetical protein